MCASARRDSIQDAAPAASAVSPLSPPPAEPPRERFDIVVAGAGHNSLITAAYLAKAGYRCLVLEGRPEVGGGVKTAQLTLRGFHDDVCSTAHSGIQANPLLRNDELRLRDYGLEYITPDPIFHVAFGDGTSLTQWRDLDRTAAEFAKFSPKDAAAYHRMLAEFDQVKAAFGAASFNPIGFGPSLIERLAKVPRSRLWQRRLAMSAWEIIRDNFADDHSRAALLFMGHLSSEAPSDPVTGRMAYAFAGQQHAGRPLPKGGSGMLTQALARFLEAHQAVILTNKWVRSFIIENGRCAGVECDDGTSYRADKAVLSTIHIKDLVKMAPLPLWGQDFLDGVQTWQGERTMFVSHYATSAPPTYAVPGGSLTPTEAGIIANAERALRFAFDDTSGAVNLDDPPLQVICCSVADPSRTPPGMHTLKIIGFQPYNLKEGPQHWDQIKHQVDQANLNYLRRFSPSLTDDKILARFLTSPLDIERMNPHFWHGSAHGGRQDAAQSGPMRPMLGWAQHRMPIPGLYQTGATTHPGGSVTGAPGRNAAVVMLKDFGTSIEEVVGRKT